MTAIRARFADGRCHFQHGPMDVILAAEGDAEAVAAADEAAWTRFEPLLDELVSELLALKQAVGSRCTLHGPVARRMWQACEPHRLQFVTPMAAVAGAVADELIACYRRPGIHRAWANNGGDIAVHLAVGASARVGLFADLARFDAPRSTLEVDGRFTITHAQAVRGVATSGWRGRSFSLGIADSVTVLARTAADADAAATMIGNAVDVDDARIVRKPASAVRDDSDLGDRLVTVDVPQLGADAARRAVAAGIAHAASLRDGGTIAACAIVCQGIMATTDAWHGARLDPALSEAA
jgi:uncharacterized protein